MHTEANCLSNKRSITINNAHRSHPLELKTLPWLTTMTIMMYALILASNVYSLILIRK